MSGFMIDIRVMTEEEASLKENIKSRVLAKWDASIHGIKGLDDLVQQGYAKIVLYAGYPRRYVSTSRIMIIYLMFGQPKAPFNEYIEQLNDPEFTGFVYGHIPDYTFDVDKLKPHGLLGKVQINSELFDHCLLNPDQTLIIDAWDIT